MCLSFILFTGGGCGIPTHPQEAAVPPRQTPPRQTPPWVDTPQEADPPGRHPPGQTHPQADTTPGRHPPARHSQSRHPRQTPKPPGRYPLGRHTPRADTPPGRHPLGRHPRADPPRQTTPRADTHPPGRHPKADTPQEQTPPPQSMLGDMVNARVVRILLECNLVIVPIMYTDTIHNLFAHILFIVHPPSPPPQTNSHGRHSPRQTSPQSRHTLRADNPPGQTPPQEQTPPRKACWEIWSTRGRYASYWNAILFLCLYTARQRSCGKVMFSQVCVILCMGWVGMPDPRFLMAGDGYAWSRVLSEGYAWSRSLLGCGWIHM